jgi:hypothetical protein
VYLPNSKSKSRHKCKTEKTKAISARTAPDLGVLVNFDIVLHCEKFEM